MSKDVLILFFNAIVARFQREMFPIGSHEDAKPYFTAKHNHFWYK